MARLFVAIPLSPPTREQLVAVQPPKTPGIRPVTAENLHLTLRFIGDADVETIVQALTRVSLPSFTLTLSTQRRIGKGIVWLGVEENRILSALYAAVGQALEKAGVTLQTRRFMPHITLARYKRHVPQELIKELIKGAVQPIEETVGAFGLYSSKLTEDGPIYKRVRAYPLQERSPAISR